jgi:hypothetical protein
MSKTRLGERLAAQGIAYEHRRALGTPADLRWLYKNNRVAEGHDAYRRHVEEASGGDLDALAAELAGGPRTALLCLEAEPASATAACSSRRCAAGRPASRSSTSSGARRRSRAARRSPRRA